MYKIGKYLQIKKLKLAANVKYKNRLALTELFLCHVYGQLYRIKTIIKTII